MGKKIIVEFDDILMTHFPSDVKHVVGETVSGIQRMHGKQVVTKLHHANWGMDLLTVYWKNGEKDVRAIITRGSDQRLLTIHDRLRLTLEDYTGPGERSTYLTCVLRRALLKNLVTVHSNLCDVTIEELDDISGYDTIQTLKNYGASKIGTKEELFGDTGRARHRPWVIFPKKNMDIPAIVFIMTRILPVTLKPPKIR